MAVFLVIFPSLSFVFLSTDLASVTGARVWGLMAVLWRLPAMGALFHLGGRGGGGGCRLTSV